MFPGIGRWCDRDSEYSNWQEGGKTNQMKDFGAPYADRIRYSDITWVLSEGEPSAVVAGN